MRISDSDLRLLETFITSDDLVKLETRFARFNIFEALKVERRELNHSSFLAFLLDPYGSHGLRDLFLRRFLQDVVKYAENEPPIFSAIELDLMDLMPAEVVCEQDNIDILLHHPAKKFAVVIENKVDSRQHSDQLNRYVETASRRLPEGKIQGIYLTPECDDPNNPKYIAYSYDKIRLLICEVLKRENILISDDVRSALHQYSDLLGRRFMADIELKELCASIYRRHKQAIEILMDNIPDEREELVTFIRQLITDSGFVLDDSNNSYVRFFSPELEQPIFHGSENWTVSGLLVLPEFVVTRDSIRLVLRMGPGIPEKRRAIHEFALQHKPLFSPAKMLRDKWQNLYSTPILRANDYEKDPEILKEIIEKKWKDFISGDFKKMREQILIHTWPMAGGRYI